ncbi:MAG: AbrB/MazE/SpoVT family DNA-binding domain-containing protein [Chloroflexota bacterium]
MKLIKAGRFRIPKNLRKKYKHQPGDKIRLIDNCGLISLNPAFNNPNSSTAGFLKEQDSLTPFLIDEHNQALLDEN